MQNNIEIIFHLEFKSFLNVKKIICISKNKLCF